MADKETIAVYDARIESYTDLVKRDKPDPVLLEFIGKVKPEGYVLDLGCGPALAAATMREHGLKVDPVDASPEMIALANSTFDIGARQAEFGDISGTDVYDGIWANFSLLHAPADEFPQILASLTQTLKRGGILHLGMKIGKGSKRDSLGRFYCYYSEQQLIRSLLDLGYTINTIKRAEGKGLAGDIEPWIMLSGILPNTPGGL